VKLFDYIYIDACDSGMLYYIHYYTQYTHFLLRAIVAAQILPECLNLDFISQVFGSLSLASSLVSQRHAESGSTKL